MLMDMTTDHECDHHRAATEAPMAPGLRRPPAVSRSRGRRIALQPLSGCRVVEIGHALAGPIAATFLADFGAEVIKIERPGEGDSLRRMGPAKDGVGLWWLVTGRNKKSVTLDLKAKAARPVLEDLLRKTDVLVENHRPGVMERLGLGWPEIERINPRIVMLRVSGFGQSGPYSARGGFGKIAEAFSGATNLTGHRGQAAVHPGYSLGDAVSGLSGAFGVALALLARERSGRGQMIDLALYEPLFRLIEWQIPMHLLAGLNVERNGAQFPFTDAFITNIFVTAEGHSVVFSAATRDSIERVRKLLGEEGVTKGGESTDELDAGLKRWAAGHPRDYVLQRFKDCDLVNGLVYTPAEILADEHFRARQNIVTALHKTLGEIPMPSVMPQLSATPGKVNWPGPALGEHTEAVLRDLLGYDAGRLAALRAERAI